jgi:hypothetical protein
LLKEWASDASTLDEQRAALRKREDDVASQQQVVQQLIVGVAGMAKHAQQNVAASRALAGAGPEGQQACSERD